MAIIGIARAGGGGGAERVMGTGIGGGFGFGLILRVGSSGIVVFIEVLEVLRVSCASVQSSPVLWVTCAR